ncbi:hypothetical protein D9613_009605 [Agrocybe pediades]|uniref:Zn(2)-C6 fungal-type domain-containing protein n=1 Tax=Agrocybe pediades TaxID=84607 RepID=A0A8H4R3S4_9AGAR|nr:hypothetical protein D9613_009605 [Agrocybe pediades]
MHPACNNCVRHGVPCVYSAEREKVFNPPERILSGSGALSAPSSSSAVESIKRCQACNGVHPSTIRFDWSSDFPGALPACTITSFFPSSHSSIPSVQPLSTIDLSLLHHFTIATSQTFSPLPDVTEAWSHIVPGPELGGRWTFVLHACLAAAGAHLTSSNSNLSNHGNEAAVLAEYHYSAAMTLMREEICNITEHNCNALFAAAAACNYYMLSRRPSQQGSSSQAVTINTISTELDLSWTLLVRSTFGILQQSWQWERKGPLSAMMTRLYPEPSTTIPHKLTKNTEQMIEKLHNLASEWGFGLGTMCEEEELGDVQTATAYYIAAWNLRRIWVVLEYCLGASSLSPHSSATASIHEEPLSENNQPVAPHPKTKRRRIIYRPDLLSSSLFQFVLRTPARFWECLEKKKPRALIIYAHFSACWEALHYGESVFGTAQLTPTSHRPGKDKKDGYGTGEWWTRGRAAMDLESVEEELLRQDAQGAVWRKWIEGARRCYDGLREGWWLEEETEQLGSPSSFGRIDMQAEPHEAQFAAHLNLTAAGSDAVFNEDWIVDMLRAEVPFLGAPTDFGPLPSTFFNGTDFQ